MWAGGLSELHFLHVDIGLSSYRDIVKVNCGFGECASQGGCTSCRNAFERLTDEAETDFAVQIAQAAKKLRILRVRSWFTPMGRSTVTCNIIRDWREGEIVIAKEFDVITER